MIKTKVAFWHIVENIKISNTQNFCQKLICLGILFNRCAQISADGLG